MKNKTFLKPKQANLFLPNRAVFVDATPEKNAEKPQNNAFANALEANAIRDAKGEKLASGKEAAATYCGEIETKMETATKRLSSVETEPLPGKPDINDAKYKDLTDAQKEKAWSADNDIYFKKVEAYNAEIVKTIPGMLAGMKRAPENGKVVDRIAKQLGAEAAGEKVNTVTTLPSVLAEKIYLNYKINGEAEGGWAVQKDLSDVPDLVDDGSINLAKFKTRTDTLNSAINETASKLDAIRKKYS